MNLFGHLLSALESNFVFAAKKKVTLLPNSEEYTGGMILLLVGGFTNGSKEFRFSSRPQV